MTNYLKLGRRKGDQLLKETSCVGEKVQWLLKIRVNNQVKEIPLQMERW